MAPAGKFRQPVSVVAISGVLILLSVSAAGDRQCSWCGPLADQVHRSQRAPSCDEPGETTCDNGLSHCSIIASSPPYVESRLCVKYYQDECYSIFCNSSRTWRMTCPCRGDFCNKEKTEREHVAFALIARLGSKIQNLRIKKRTVTPGKFLSQTTNKTTIVNKEDETSNNSTQSEHSKNVLTEIENATVAIENNKINPETITNDSNGNISMDKSNNDSNNDPNQNEVNNEESKSETSGITMNDAKSNNAMDKSSNEDNSVTNANRNNNEDEATMADDMPASTKIPVSVTEAISDVTTSEIPSMEEPRKDINIDVPNNIDHVAETTTKNSIDEKTLMKIDIKPSMALPAAEALQQNSSPSAVSAVTEKSQPTTERVTTETTVMLTTAHVHVTASPDPMKMKNNHAVTTSLHFVPPLFWTMLYF